MEDIFNKCGLEVPVVNILALFVKTRHRMATRIQAWFKGALVREWVHEGKCKSWDAVNKYTLSDAWVDMHDEYPSGVDERWLIDGGPSGLGRIKMETVERLNGRPFGGVRVVFHYHKFLRFHLVVPSKEDTIQLDNYERKKVLESRIKKRHRTRNKMAELTHLKFQDTTHEVKDQVISGYPPQEVLTRAKMGGPRTPCQDCYCLTCRCNW